MARRPPGAGAADPAIGEDSVLAFRKLVLGFYAEKGRSFPWRETRDPWAILVSEIMLQQTQTERVVPKYLAWMKAFPKPADLAEAPLSRVMELWSGLGYNRRALALRDAAAAIARRGCVPDDEDGLVALPGIGPYTAGAVLAFAFGRAVPFIETNIRSVFLHRFFPGEEGVSDRRIMALVEATLDRDDPRTWYYALMDYGVELKKAAGNPNVRSAHYARQAPFADSNRRLRGAILRHLGTAKEAGIEELGAALPFSLERIGEALGQLASERFVAEDEGRYRIAD